MTIKECIRTLKASHQSFKVIAEEDDLLRIVIDAGDVYVDGWFKQVDDCDILRLLTVDCFAVVDGVTCKVLEMDRHDIGGLITETNPLAIRYAFIKAMALYDYYNN